LVVVVGAAISAGGWRSWLALVVDSSSWRCNQLMVGARVVGGRGRRCYQNSWSMIVAAIISWSALPSALVVGTVISARGQR
jgi:hypothetical protein